MHVEIKTWNMRYDDGVLLTDLNCDRMIQGFQGLGWQGKIKISYYVLLTLHVSSRLEVHKTFYLFFRLPQSVWSSAPSPATRLWWPTVVTTFRRPWSEPSSPLLTQPAKDSSTPGPHAGVSTVRPSSWWSRYMHLLAHFLKSNLLFSLRHIDRQRGERPPGPLQVRQRRLLAPLPDWDRHLFGIVFSFQNNIAVRQYNM